MDVDYRGKVRGNSLDTSWSAAAMQTEGKVDRVKRAIIDLIRSRGAMTDEQLVDAFDELRRTSPTLPAAAPSNVRTRRHELHVDGVLRDTGVRLKTRSGATAAVWQLSEAVPAGEATA